MTDNQFELLYNLVKELNDTIKENNKILIDVKNLFLKYDEVEAIADEIEREGS